MVSPCSETQLKVSNHFIAQTPTIFLVRVNFSSCSNVCLVLFLISLTRLGSHLFRHFFFVFFRYVCFTIKFIYMFSVYYTRYNIFFVCFPSLFSLYVYLCCWQRLKYSVHDFMAWPWLTSLPVLHDDTFSLCRSLKRQSMYLCTTGTNSGSDQSVCKNTIFLITCHPLKQVNCLPTKFWVCLRWR